MNSPTSSSLKSPSNSSSSLSKTHKLKSLSYSFKPTLKTPYLQELSPPINASPVSKTSKARFVSFKDVHGNQAIPLISEENSSVRDSPASRTNKYKTPTSISPTNQDEVNSDPKKVSLPQLSSRLGHSMYNSPDCVRTEGYEETSSSLFYSTLMSPVDSFSPDYVKQTEFLNTSPHFMRFNKLNTVLSKIDAKKSSLSKELFYYPDQIETFKKLSIQASLSMTNRDSDSDMGVVGINENTRTEVNLLEGRNAYFRLICQGKIFPLKVKVDVFTGSFEIRVSRTQNKPSSQNYDHLFVVPNFEIIYDNEQRTKYLYFGIHALERLRLNFTVSFTVKPKAKTMLSPVNMDKEKMRRKRKAYEFFNKEMRPEEVQHLIKIVEEIREEKQKKAFSLNNNINIPHVNMMLASHYDTFKTDRLINTVKQREIKQKMTQQNRDQHNQERYKKYLCETFRSDIRRLKNSWEIEESDKKRIMASHQRIFSVIITMFSVYREIADKITVLRIVKRIKKSIEIKVLGIQKFVRIFLQRPLTIGEPRGGQKPLTVEEAKTSINIFHALNAWALHRRKFVMKKVPVVINKFLEDLFTPFAILEASKKYEQKVALVQEKWKRRKQMANAKLDMFMLYWEKYCKSLVAQEKNKVKKQNSLLIPQITEEHVRRHGLHFLRNKTKAFIKAASVFITMQAHPVPFKTVKSTPRKNIENGKTNNSRNSTILSPKSKGSVHIETDQHHEDGSENKMDQYSAVVPIKPTDDELKSIFDKIIIELKEEHKI